MQPLLPKLARVLLLHKVRLYCKRWVSPLQYRSLPALGQYHRRGRHGVDDRPASHFVGTAPILDTRLDYG